MSFACACSGVIRASYGLLWACPALALELFRASSGLALELLELRLGLLWSLFGLRMGFLWSCLSICQCLSRFFALQLGLLWVFRASTTNCLGLLWSFLPSSRLALELFAFAWGSPSASKLRPGACSGMFCAVVPLCLLLFALSLAFCLGPCWTCSGHFGLRLSLL